jgi:hypothetical protein
MQKKIGYKATRTTVVLALRSQHLKSIQDPGLLAALSNAAGVNYNLARMVDGDLELIYAHFTEEVTHKVLGEYVFYPARGNVRDNKTACASCSLCGKGDSRDDGANEDHIRYEFKLTNIAGGESIWCGSTCIINHSLRVDGAETSEAARKLLQKSFREHLKAWEREAWRLDNPDHTNIPDLYRDGCQGYSIRRYAYQQDVFGALGYSYESLKAAHQRVYGYYGRNGTFRRAVRFYQRAEWLTESKHEVWLEAKMLRSAIADIESSLLAGQHLKGDTLLAFLRARAEAKKAPPRIIEAV